MDLHGKAVSPNLDLASPPTPGGTPLAHIILSYLVAVFDLNLNFSNFPIVTGKKWCGSMCLFGCGTNLGAELSVFFHFKTAYLLVIWLFFLLGDI